MKYFTNSLNLYTPFKPGHGGDVDSHGVITGIIVYIPGASGTLKDGRREPRQPPSLRPLTPPGTQTGATRVVSTSRKETKSLVSRASA